MDRATIVFIVVTALSVETVLWGTFVRSYFTTGIALFQHNSPCVREFGAPPSPDRLLTALPKSIFGEFVFSAIDEDHYVFRECFLCGYTPIMHGSLRFDRDTGCVAVKGLANWYPILFLVAAPALNGALTALPVLAVLFVIYMVQAVRYSEIATIAAKCWRQS